MGDISKLQSGQTFQVVQRKTKTPVPQGMTIQESAQFNRTTQKEQAEISGIKQNFADRFAENGKVELLVEGGDGVAVVQGSKINLAELAQKGNALAEYALELKAYDKKGNNDGFITEDELRTDWGEHLTQSALTVGGATVGGAGTGAGVGVFFGGVGAGPGALAGAAVGATGSALWEGFRTIGYAFGDSYDSPNWAR
ncbi:MAG: DUF6861 domain-containing protein [Candidatus Sericytochromatia bacterium]